MKSLATILDGYIPTKILDEETVSFLFFLSFLTNNESKKTQNKFSEIELSEKVKIFPQQTSDIIPTFESVIWFINLLN